MVGDFTHRQKFQHVLCVARVIHITVHSSPSSIRQAEYEKRAQQSHCQNDVTQWASTTVPAQQENREKWKHGCIYTEMASNVRLDLNGVSLLMINDDKCMHYDAFTALWLIFTALWLIFTVLWLTPCTMTLIHYTMTHIRCTMTYICCTMTHICSTVTRIAALWLIFALICCTMTHICCNMAHIHCTMTNVCCTMTHIRCTMTHTRRTMT